MTENPPIHCAHDAVVPIGELLPNPKNPNKHPDLQIMALGKIIREQGWRRSIRVSRRSGFIVAGHGAFACARAEGFTVVPVDYQDYESESSEWADLLADNRIAELAEIEDAKLACILKDLQVANDLAEDHDKFDLTLSAYSDDEITDIIESLEEAEDEGPTKEKESKPLTGDLLELIGRAIGKSPDDLADFKVRIYGANPETWKVDLTRKQIVLKK